MRFSCNCAGLSFSPAINETQNQETNIEVLNFKAFTGWTLKNFTKKQTSAYYRDLIYFLEIFSCIFSEEFFIQRTERGVIGSGECCFKRGPWLSAASRLA